jgi:lysophospholipase L1-like esterase
MIGLFTFLVASGESCTPTVVPKPSRVVLYGDSITASVGASSGHGTVQYVWQEARPDLIVTAYGRSGCAVTPGSAYGRCLVSGVIYLAPQIVAIWTGMNDFQQQMPLAKFRSAYGADLDALAGHRRYCLLLTYRVGEEQFAAHIGEYRDVIREECEARGLPVLDPRDALPTGSDALYDTPAHPNDAGNYLLGRWLAEVVQ